MMRIDLTEMELEDVLVALRGCRDTLKRDCSTTKVRSAKAFFKDRVECYRALISKFDNVRKGKEHECTESDEA